jgi:hypothetical protein
MIQRILMMENDLEQKANHGTFEDYHFYNGHVLTQADAMRRVSHSHGMPAEILTQKKAVESCYRAILQHGRADWGYESNVSQVPKIKPSAPLSSSVPEHLHQLPTPKSNPPKLELKDYEAAAKTLGCEIEVIRAVGKVESKGDGFRKDGRPQILFEPHKFRQAAERVYDKDHPDISHEYSSEHKGDSYGHLQKAINLKNSDTKKSEYESGITSCSWGKFQIMGEYYKLLGYKNAEEFVNAMYESEKKHLDAFIKFIKNVDSRCQTALIKKNWSKFALYYNGKKYKDYKYHIHMKEAYEYYIKNPDKTT